MIEKADDIWTELTVEQVMTMSIGIITAAGKIEEVSLYPYQNYYIYVSNLKKLMGHIAFGPASVAQFDAPSDWRPGGCGFNPRQGWQHSFEEIDHEIFSMVILSLPLIQEGQLSVSGERMCTILVNRLED